MRWRHQEEKKKTLRQRDKKRFITTRVETNVEQRDLLDRCCAISTRHSDVFSRQAGHKLEMKHVCQMKSGILRQMCGRHCLARNCSKTPRHWNVLSRFVKGWNNEIRPPIESATSSLNLHVGMWRGLITKVRQIASCNNNAVLLATALTRHNSCEQFIILRK